MNNSAAAANEFEFGAIPKFINFQKKDDENLEKITSFWSDSMSAAANESNLGIELWYHDNKDFTIIVDGKEIHAHKCVLSTRSPVFAAMLKPYTQEAQDNQVVITDFTFNVVEAAIKHCYDSSLVKDVPLKDMMSLLQFFDKYDMRLLKHDIEEQLISKIDKTTVCQLVNFSITFNASKLRIKCSDFLQRCIRYRKHVFDMKTLNKDFALELLEDACQPLSGSSFY